MSICRSTAALADRPACSANKPAERVPPDFTGWAQINNGRRVGPEEKGALGEWYIQNASLWLDIRIILRMIGIVLFGDGFGSAGQWKLPDPGGERSDSKHADKCCEVRRPGADWPRDG